MRLLLILPSIIFLFTGCALTNRTISLTTTTSHSSITKVAHTPITITTEDLRAKPDVGYVQNILGMKIARILLDEPLKEILHKSLEKALKAQGYLVIEKTPNTMRLNITLNECYTRYDERVFRKKAIADLDLIATSLNSQNQVIFTKKIHTQGKASPFLWLSTKTVQKAINQALDKALLMLFQEENLFKEN